MARISKRPEIYLQLSKQHSSSECSEYKCEQPSSNSSLLTRLTSNYQLKAEKQLPISSCCTCTTGNESILLLSAGGAPVLSSWFKS